VFLGQAAKRGHPRHLRGQAAGNNPQCVALFAGKDPAPAVSKAQGACITAAAQGQRYGQVAHSGRVDHGPCIRRRCGGDQGRSGRQRQVGAPEQQRFLFGIVEGASGSGPVAVVCRAPKRALLHPESLRNPRHGRVELRHVVTAQTTEIKQFAQPHGLPGRRVGELRRGARDRGEHGARNRRDDDRSRFERLDFRANGVGAAHKVDRRHGAHVLGLQSAQKPGPPFARGAERGQDNLGPMRGKHLPALLCVFSHQGLRSEVCEGGGQRLSEFRVRLDNEDPLGPLKRHGSILRQFFFASCPDSATGRASGGGSYLVRPSSTAMPGRGVP
jgi:hypothetical protein